MNLATPPIEAPTAGPDTAAGTPLAPDCHGLNFFEIDRSLQDLLPLYLPDVLGWNGAPCPGRPCREPV